ncbi:FtsK/SpoIIIE domain-containing protein [Listeria ilorinensis]|uniref:FtsK/SpoIIIE domain-containing protein n=1 Tax=Listeria ilorinensis TaxID=2867439 RepID=UPI001EF54354|nr:FtsK/SpoIIIE domain-containing protein [Listeria ilorinensis]
MKYHGSKIQPWMRHLFLRLFSSIFGVVFLILEARFLLLNFDMINNKAALHNSLMNLLVAVLITLLIGFCVAPFWKRLYFMQRLSQMIWQSKFYQVNDVEEPNAFNEKIRAKVKREMVTWAKIRFKMHGDHLYIACYMGGYAFQSELENLSTKLEAMFHADVVGMKQDGYYYVYHIRLHIYKSRLQIADMKPQDYIIPLMKGLKWNVSKVPGALITGEAGGGKTYFMLSLISALLKMDARLKIYDPKNADLADLASIDGFTKVHEVQTNMNKIAESIRLTVAEMERRYEYVKTLPNYKVGEDFSYYGLPPVVIIFDEYLAFSKKLEKEKHKVEAQLSDLALKGRQMGFFVIFGMQRADADALRADIRDQLGARFVLGDLSPDGYRMTFKGLPKRYVATGEAGRGYCYIKGVTSCVQTFYAPFVPPNYQFLEKIQESFVCSALGASALEVPGGAIANEQEQTCAAERRAIEEDGKGEIEK